MSPQFQKLKPLMEAIEQGKTYPFLMAALDELMAEIEEHINLAAIAPYRSMANPREQPVYPITIEPSDKTQVTIKGLNLRQHYAGLFVASQFLEGVSDTLIEHAIETADILIAKLHHTQDLWTLTVNELPTPHKQVIVHGYRSISNRERFVSTAVWIPEATKLADEWLGGTSPDYSFNDDGHYPEGWYECVEGQKRLTLIDGAITRWTDIPYIHQPKFAPAWKS